MSSTVRTLFMKDHAPRYQTSATPESQPLRAPASANSSSSRAHRSPRRTWCGLVSREGERGKAVRGWSELLELSRLEPRRGEEKKGRGGNCLAIISIREPGVGRRRRLGRSRGEEVNRKCRSLNTKDRARAKQHANTDSTAISQHVEITPSPTPLGFIHENESPD